MTRCRMQIDPRRHRCAGVQAHLCLPRVQIYLRQPRCAGLQIRPRRPGCRQLPIPLLRHPCAKLPIHAHSCPAFSSRSRPATRHHYRHWVRSVFVIKANQTLHLSVNGNLQAVMKKVRYVDGALDALDSAILRALANDARTPMRELAQIIGLSAPSTTERVRRLEAAGVIEGYTVRVNPNALGLPVGRREE